MVEHAGDRRIDAASKPAALSRDVDERNRGGVEPGVLIHELANAARARRFAGTASM